MLQRVVLNELSKEILPGKVAKDAVVAAVLQYSLLLALGASLAQLGFLSDNN